MEASNFFIGGGYYGLAGGNRENGYFDQNATDVNNHFAVDDLLDFSNEDEFMNDAFLDSVAGNSADSSTVTVVDSCNSSVSGGELNFSGNVSCRSFSDAPFAGGELCIPYDDLAELEWLSNFGEESFSSDDLHNLRLITAAKSSTDASSSIATAEDPETAIGIRNKTPIFQPDVSVPGKARSKRSRAAPGDWSSRLLSLVASENTSKELKETLPSKKLENTETPGRRCLHCASDKTPQWRTGPMGPKTLCNACGVRYKSGRLVPEYRPAASPTFMLAKHSNSHRKVLELRRQKELRLAAQDQQQQQQQLFSQTSIFSSSNGSDYLIHHQSGGHDFRHMI